MKFDGIDSTRLIQRLKRPDSYTIREKANPFGRQGWNDTPMLSAEADAKLKEVCIFDYMGDARFETDRQQKTLEYLFENSKSLVGFRGNIYVKAPIGSLHLNESQSATFYFVTPVRLINYAWHIARYEAGYRNMSWRQVDLNRASLVRDSVFDSSKGKKGVCGWLVLDEGQPFFFSTDLKMAKGFSELVHMENRPNFPHRRRIAAYLQQWGMECVCQ